MTMLKVGEAPTTKLGATPIAAPGWTGEPRERVGLVDCDVHHNFCKPTDLLPYLSKYYQDHLLDQGLHLPMGIQIPRCVQIDPT